MSQTAEDILHGPDYFFCERNKCRVRRSICGERIAELAASPKYRWVGNTGKGYRMLSNAYIRLGKCVGCDQGARNVESENRRKGDTVMETKANANLDSPAVAGEMMEKTCSKCGMTKPLDEFYNDKNAKSGKKSSCKPCADVQITEWKRRMREKKRASAAPVEKVDRAVSQPSGSDFPAPEIPGGNEHVITIDFTGREQLLDHVNDEAKRQFRNPDQQILYFLSLHCRPKEAVNEAQ